MNDLFHTVEMREQLLFFHVPRPDKEQEFTGGSCLRLNVVEVDSVLFEQFPNSGIFLCRYPLFDECLVALEALTAVHAHKLHLGHALEDGHQSIYFRSEGFFGQHRDVARLNRKKDKLRVQACL